MCGCALRMTSGGGRWRYVYTCMCRMKLSGSNICSLDTNANVHIETYRTVSPSFEAEGFTMPSVRTLPSPNCKAGLLSLISRN